MALAVLPAIIVSFVIVVASLGTFYIYRAYRRVRYAVHDVERSRHIEIAGLSQQRPIELHDLEGPRKQYHSGQWYGSESVVSTHVAPAAKPLPHTPEIEYSGGEWLVRPPGRVFLSTGVQQPELLSPKPVRTVTTRPKAEPASTAYDPDQTAASEIWNKIEKGELDPSRRKAQKKSPKKPNAPVPEVLRDPSEFERDTMIDVDLDNSTREWAKPNRPALPFTPRLNKRESSDSMATVVDANNANIERPQSYVKRKQSIGTGAIKPTEPLDRAAEARRQMTERKKQMVERQKQEEADRLAEEQRLVDEQKQRAAEQQRLAEEKQRQEDEEKARSLAQVSDDEDIDLDNKRPSDSQRPRTRRRSDSSSKSKRERKSRETLLTRTPKRAYTFANDASDGIDSPDTNEKTARNIKGSSRSMSMNDQARPDFNATMPSIAEGAHVDPFFDNAARRSYGSTKKSVSSMYSPDHISLNDGEGNYTSRPADYKRRAAPEDTLENPFASDNDPQDPFATAQRSSAASSNDSRVSFSQVKRRSNASSNESRNSSGTNYPKRSDSKASAKNRASVDSQSSQQSARGREKPERKPSVASRAFSKISRKSSSSDKKKERDSASSTQSRENEGPGLRGGGKMYVEEPEELSSSEDEHEDRTKQEHKVKNGVEMRGGSGEKDESESEVEVETEHEDESDAAEVGHSEDEHSDVSSSDEDEIESEKHDSSEEEGSGDDDDASEDGDSESEISDAGTSDAITSDDESEEEVSDDEQGPVLKKPIEVVGVPAGNAGRVKA
ncbi:uncharacterized protein J4E88_005443 [Alternaria novae-zelandiae]|uniref:uncharacterized protein n=1 Tax=Alternaria novae-zelandiae TaxID=430562 RepID=UPI0020C3FA90|nr:uncharacterized protein J4E88_005443 [Alternaria novae-zelandiae]KAI4680938.1 hypothetical protein J4E88_005443 [Alternaria novae-zelandiae]